MMPFSVDTFLDRMPRKNYTCVHFVREVWLALVGEDVQLRLERLINSVGNGKLSTAVIKEFVWLKEPVSPCFVVMQRFRYTPHVGIFLDGRILHLRAYGVEFQPLVVAISHFHTVKYYR